VPLLADCHLHFEGSLPVGVLEELARRSGHSFARSGEFVSRRDGIRDSAGFLALFADVCRLLRSPDDYAFAAESLSRALAEDGVGYAEVYVSPEICTRFKLDALGCLEAVDAGFAAGEASGGARCAILLDTVRQWGPEAAERVLDLHERRPLRRVAGFGMGGEEGSIPAAAFGGVYARARALGLMTSVHAGEWAGPESIRDALDSLRPDRIDHGVSAASDPLLMERLADEDTPLLIATTSNVRTGACRSLAEHPLPRLLAAGVPVALSADDPLLFGTTTSREYSEAARAFRLDAVALRAIAARSWRAAFGLTAAEREAGARKLAAWQPPGQPGVPLSGPASPRPSSTL
jgi:adenosine deaminase